MPIRTSEETAVILATMMTRAEATRARVSDKTIRIVSGRKRLEGSFRVSLNDDLVEYGFVIVPLSIGGQAIIRISALEAAKPLTAARSLQPTEIAGLRREHAQLVRGMREELEAEVEEESDA